MVGADFHELDWVEEIFRSYNHPWFFCGGWALDLFLGCKTREHSDIEVGIFREYQIVLQRHLSGWSLSYLQDGNKKEWKNGLYLDLPTHEILAESEKYKLEILLNEKAGNNWIYRRNNRVQLPLEKAILTNNNGFPFLCPEAILLYKSKNIRPKDQQDFEIILPHLNEEQKRWLKQSLTLIDKTHQWIEKL